MFIDARTLPADERLEFDLCIVGAGAAGITLAQALAGPARRVALVESGGFEPDAATQDLNIGESVGLSYSVAESRLRYFGGTTNHWAGNCRPLDEIEFTRRDWLPNSGWPFPRAALEPLYQRARPLCDVPPMPAGALDPRSLGIVPVPWSEPLETALWQGSPPTRFGEKFRAPLAHAAGLTVLLNATLLGLEPAADAMAIAAARFGTLSGGRFAIAARRYVVACGGLENARLLLLTASQAWPDGIGNRYDLVGRFFMDHPQLWPGALIHNRPTRADLTHQFPTGDGTFYEGFRLSDAAQRASRTGNVGFFPLWLRDASPAFDERSLGPLVQDTASRLAGSGPAGKRIATNMFVTLEQSPDRDSRITLAEGRDAFGLRRLRLDWRLNGLDRHSFATAVRTLAREAGRQRIGRFWLRPPFRGIDFHDPATIRFDIPAPGVRNKHQLDTELGWGCHHIGTTRMHDDPRLGVVDADCRVHGIANLYIAGSSVFPTAGLSNPTLTVVALALRLADRLEAGG